jgi:hypothetical protein
VQEEFDTGHFVPAPRAIIKIGHSEEVLQLDGFRTDMDVFNDPSIEPKCIADIEIGVGFYLDL